MQKDNIIIIIIFIISSSRLLPVRTFNKPGGKRPDVPTTSHLSTLELDRLCTVSLYYMCKLMKSNRFNATVQHPSWYWRGDDKVNQYYPDHYWYWWCCTKVIAQTNKQTKKERNPVSTAACWAAITTLNCWTMTLGVSSCVWQGLGRRWQARRSRLSWCGSNI